jgi:dolichyl-phosphate beta-glucosyltransferase
MTGRWEANGRIGKEPFAMVDTVLVIPCFNEAARLPLDAFRQFVENRPEVRLLFVDDGSLDSTNERLRNFCATIAPFASLLSLPKNVGKGEAVRQGCLAAFASAPRYIGYWDADLATPLEEVVHFRDALNDRPRVEIVYGSRVRMMGRSIQRTPLRHFLSRTFANMAAFTLGLACNDTQCGAKLFRASPLMETVLRCPFLTRWLFDVEILARLIRAGRHAQLPPIDELVFELPLTTWHDRTGSKVRWHDFPRAFLDLVRIRSHYFRSSATEPCDLGMRIRRDCQSAQARQAA